MSTRAAASAAGSTTCTVEAPRRAPRQRSEGVARRARAKTESKIAAAAAAGVPLQKRAKGGRRRVIVPRPHDARDEPPPSATPLDIGPRRAPPETLAPVERAFLDGLAIHTDQNLNSDEVLPITQNVVVKVEFADPHNLHHIAANSFDAEYQPSNFAACIMRQKGHNATSLLFEEGTLICVGTSSSEVARLACQLTRLELRKLGYAARIRSFKIVNRVMNYALPHRVNVERFFADHTGLANYDPEGFPGCAYEMPEYGVVALIFDSGKVIVMGFKRVETGYEAVRHLRRLLANYATAEAAAPSAERFDRRLEAHNRVIDERDAAQRRAAFVAKMRDKFGHDVETDADIAAAQKLITRLRGDKAATLLEGVVTVEKIRNALFSARTDTAAQAQAQDAAQTAPTLVLGASRKRAREADAQPAVELVYARSRA